jgi:copper chaperone CopZ
MKKIELKVSGMHCSHCEMRINKALRSVEGVKSAKANHEKGTVIVESDEGVATDSLINAVNATNLYKAQYSRDL